jgi:hypothetical protein
MAVIAPTKLPDPPAAASRRFQIPDLNHHAGWLIERLVKAFPHRTERDLIGWLRGVIYANDFLFLYQDHSVALATVSRVHPLLPKGHVQEIFVFAEAGYEAEAAVFYDDFARWAKNQGLDTIVVQEMSDVPHEAIRDKLGRMFTKTITFARM